jgi:membrane-associated phospholipid phosphatase
LIGFPSYHCILALVVCWSARSLKRLRWPLWVANALVIVSTPIQGGHHLADVLAAFPVAAIVLFIAGWREASAKPSSLVNKIPTFEPAPVPQVVFRSAMKQKNGPQPVCD